MHTNFRYLRYVVAVADHGSITVAADKIGISQPAISAAIKIVEAEIGYRLFLRNPAQRASLTPAGREFIKYAKDLLTNVQTFERFAIGLGHNVPGQLHVGCYVINAPYVLPNVLKAVAVRHPNIAVTIHEEDLAGVIHDLKNGVTDIALTYDLYLDESVAFEKVFDAHPHVILPPSDPLSSESTISLKQLVGKPLVLLELASENYFPHLFALHGLTPSVCHRVKSFEMVRGLVGAGIGYSFGRMPIKTERTYDGSPLVQRPLREKVPPSHVCLATPIPSYPRRIVEAFSDVCRAVCSQSGSPRLALIGP